MGKPLYLERHPDKSGLSDAGKGKKGIRTWYRKKKANEGQKARFPWRVTAIEGGGKSMHYSYVKRCAPERGKKRN